MKDKSDRAQRMVSSLSSAERPNGPNRSPDVQLRSQGLSGLRKMPMEPCQILQRVPAYFSHSSSPAGPSTPG